MVFCSCCFQMILKRVLDRACVRAFGCYMTMSVNGNQVLLCSAETALLLHRQLSASRSNLTSSAGPLTSNTLLMADKLIGLGQAGQQMGTFRFKAAQKTSVCFSGLSFKIQTSYFHEMLRGNRFLVYGKAIKCQILDSSKQQLV